MPPVLKALLFGNFAIGCGVSGLAATLPEISSSLGVSVARAGGLITASSLMVAVGAPLCAAVVAGWDRRRLLSFAALWFGLLHIVAAAVPGIDSLMAVRVMAMIAPAIFTPQAASSVPMLVPPELRARAITFIFLGFSSSAVLGVPLAAWIRGTLVWRVTFAFIGAMGVINAIWIWRTMPDGVRATRLSAAAWSRTLRSPALMSTLAVTLTFGTGQFILWSYIAPYLKGQVGFSTGELSLVLMWFGMVGLAGNALMSRTVDRTGPAAAVMTSLALSAVTLAAWPLATGFALVAVIIAPWALGYYASNSAQQARLAGIAPQLASASIALNTSAIYGGQAAGSAIGAALIALGRWDALHWAALAAMLVAMAGSALATRLARMHALAA